MPPKKKLRVDVAPVGKDTATWIAANDDLIAKDKEYTLGEVLRECKVRSFQKQIIDATTKCPVDVKPDWAAFTEAFNSRTLTSPRWFVQRRVDDLLLDPDGTMAEHVDCFVIVELHDVSLSPRFYVVAERFPDADAEDYVPERVLDLGDQGVFWYPLLKDDGSGANAFVLGRPPVAAFSFGAAPATAAPAAAAPATAAPATAAPAAAVGFGFGFGAAAAPAAAPMAFSFGGGAALAPAVPLAPAPSVPLAPSPVVPPALPSLKRIPVEDILISLWTKSKAKDALKLASSGSRIKIENCTIPTISKSVTIEMQDDAKDTPRKAAEELVLKQLFAQQNSRIVAVEKWMGECPEVDDVIAAPLQRYHSKLVALEAKSGVAVGNERTYADFFKEVVPEIEKRLEAACAVRRPIRNDQRERINRISALLAERKLASKETTVIRKFYPSNSKIPFRPYGKVSGMTEEGEQAVCVPQVFRFFNPLTNTYQ